MPIINERLNRLEREARTLAEDARTAFTYQERAAFNDRLQEHLDDVAAAAEPDTIAAKPETWCRVHGLRYLPNTDASRFTITVADECIEYANRYSLTLHDAIAEWEGEDERGGFGLAPGEKADVAGYLVERGFDLDREPTDHDPEENDA